MPKPNDFFASINSSELEYNFKNGCGLPYNCSSTISLDIVRETFVYAKNKFGRASYFNFTNFVLEDDMKYIEGE